MAVIHPFRAWRPRPEKVELIASEPYDVIDTGEARRKAEGFPQSFLHVVRPEIDLEEGTPFNDDAVYKKGAENLKNLLESDAFVQDEKPSVYVYRLIMEGRSQLGVFACVSVDDYDDEVILKHELTRPAKEDDRTRHILTQSAHAEPVMLTFRDDENITQKCEQVVVNEQPLFDFTADDGVRHTLWQVPEPKGLVGAFSKIPKLYVADGHHRCKSASRAAEELRNKNKHHTGKEEYNFFPAVLFPMDQMRIMAYNRIVYDVPDDFMEKLGETVDLRPNADPTPSKKGDVSVYYKGTWYGLTLPTQEHPNSVERLDVYRLQAYILEPLLGITDPRNDGNIDFVGGIRGIRALEWAVDKGKADLAISMYPTSIKELLAVSDAKLLMPPKSTWFEPKLRSGLLIHTF